MCNADISTWRPLFEISLHLILKEYEGTESKVREGMGDGMRKLFDMPYESEMRCLSKGEDVTVEDAQRIIFFPRPSDMKYYAEAFALETPGNLDTPGTPTRRLKLMKFKMMSVFYTLHRKDSVLMEWFMHYDGLTGLSHLLAEDHNVVQSQAVELLIELLSPLLTNQPATSVRKTHLYHQAFLCLRSRAFFDAVARVVSEPYEIFPKSHSNCVRLLAGALAWLRPEDGAIAEAGVLPDGVDICDALRKFLEGNVPVEPDIRYVGENLLGELEAVPPMRTDPLRGEELKAAQRELFDKEGLSDEDATHAWQYLRRLGNDAFKGGLLVPAEVAYRRALEAGGVAVPGSEASLIHSNRALALLKCDRYKDAAVAAKAALDLDPCNAKAAFRRAQALLGGQAPGAREALAAVEAAELAAKLEPKDTKVTELLRRAQELLQERGGAEAAAAEATAEVQHKEEEKEAEEEELLNAMD
eukprot:gnl/TRDRNA2_/TRDRNA2_192377_c0_seq1.p1 gnl/TRDRNA2_/TRDRNA2_192377_c0~~gnl/TRDRNA2_/TRDRNA2_192377_c0_seq1.p1  ORF type:complete len:471 (+),score=104.00 gnl/TRDRNA2_/TRDRNA2_192377_c0_seq1:98-1510(+)